MYAEAVNYLVNISEYCFQVIFKTQQNVRNSFLSLSFIYHSYVSHGCLENPMDRGSWWSTESDMTEATQHE